jgi:hypothetical protein
MGNREQTLGRDDKQAGGIDPGAGQDPVRRQSSRETPPILAIFLHLRGEDKAQQAQRLEKSREGWAADNRTRTRFRTQWFSVRELKSL